MAKKILLIGESALDVFVYGPVHRLSPEAPVPIQSYSRSESNPGMAGNVKANLESLSPNVQIDFFHQKKGIFKIRHIDEISGHQLLRVDDGDDSFEPEFSTQIIEGMAKNKDGYSACVISDYGKGLISETLIETIVEIMHQIGAVVYLDTKKVLGQWSMNVDFVKINQKEYNFQLTRGVTEPWKWCRNLIVTRGRDGAISYDKYGNTKDVVENTEVLPIANVSGCGDTYLAAFVVNHIENRNVKAAMVYANKASRFAASKPGVVAVKKTDIE